jgi:endonuclease G, mitochondrial
MAKKKLSMESLKAFVRSQAPEFLKRANVTSVGIGYKEKDGKPTKQLSIQFTVGRKMAPEVLETLAEPELPKSFNVNGVDVPTDILERRYEKALKLVAAEDAPTRKRAIDPIVPGVSVGHPDISAGTVGCVVYDAHSGTPYILSNWHVLNGPTGNIGDPVVQPGRHDDNRVERNKVGRLVRSHLGVAGDCAIATIDRRRLTPEIFDLGVAVERLGEAQLDDKVVKSGRTTDVTFGIVKRIHVTVQIDYEQAGTKDIGCFEIGPDPGKPAAEISMGGDSGAAWLGVERGRATNIMLGLHFAGEVGDEPDHALACYSASVFEKLEIRPTKLAEIVREDAAGLGFAIDFVGAEVAFPTAASAAIADDMLQIEGRSVIDYTHFSLAMSQSRKFARWVAWNVDGNSVKRLNRNGIPFRKDPKVPANIQIGNELYVNNDLDRGHIARRQDLLWGPEEEAARANVDSFFYTNMTPQHAGFNQSGAGGIWGELENAIFSDLEVHLLRISVLGGPILRDDDREYRGILIPSDFWKIIYFRETADGPLRAKGYVLTQKDLLNQLEVLELPQFQVFEVPILDIGSQVGLNLPTASAPEMLRRPGRRRRVVESLSEIAGIRLITSVDDIAV